eukprot:Em0356g2a
MASPAPPLPGTGADGGGRASGTSGEGDGTGGEGYSLVSEYWGNGLSIYDPEGNKIHTVMAVGGGSQAYGVMFSLWALTTHSCGTLHLLHKLSWSDLDEHVEDQTMFDCVNVLLKMQNTNGGYASNETKRGVAILEILNPSQVLKYLCKKTCM